MPLLHDPRNVRSHNHHVLRTIETSELYLNSREESMNKSLSRFPLPEKVRLNRSKFRYEIKFPPAMGLAAFLFGSIL